MPYINDDDNNNDQRINVHIPDSSKQVDESGLKTNQCRKIITTRIKHVIKLKKTQNPTPKTQIKARQNKDNKNDQRINVHTPDSSEQVHESGL